MKRIIALILSLITLLTMCTFVNSYAAESYSGAHDFLKMLGILEGDTKDFSSPVSRGEFCNIVIKALGEKAETSVVNPFSDVGDSYIYKNAVLKAYEIGFVSGNGRNRFEPEKPITFSAAVKILVEALGYSGKAYYMGGFPAGHFMVANEIELTSGISKNGDTELDFGTTLNLIYNFLNTDLCMVTDILASNSKWETVPGKNPLTEFFDLKSDSGIIKAAGFKTIIPQDKGSKKRITIGAKTFKTELDNVEKYLGKDAIVWYDDNENVKAIYESRLNSVVSIKAENIDCFSDYTLFTFDKETGNEGEYNIDRSYTFVKNGRNHIPTNADFVFPEGEIILIDNNGDGKYDVVLAEKYEYMVVSGVNANDFTVYDNKNGGKSIVLKNEDGYYSTLEIVNHDGSTEYGDIKNVSEEMVLMFKESDDRKYITAVATKQIVGGKVSEIDNDNVLIGDVWYKFNSYFFERAYIEVGKNYNFLMAPDKTITALSKVQDDTMSYGYLLNYYDGANGLSKNVQISLMTESGAYIYPYLADDVVLDGKRVKKTDSSIKNKLTNGALPKYQLIKYQLDADKNVSKIDTYEDAVSISSASGDSVLFEKYSQSYIGDNTLTRFLKPSLSYWYQTFYTFTGHAVLGSGTIIMKISNKVLGDVTEPIPENQFTVVDSGGIATDSYTIETYDVGKEMQPGVVIIYSADAGTSGIGKNNNTAIVEKVCEGINDENENVYLIYLWRRGTFYKYSINLEDYAKIKSSGNIPSSGDIIRFSRNLNGEVSNIKIDAKYDATSGNIKMTSNAPAYGSHDVNCYIGTVFSHTNSGITLLVNSDGISGASSSYSSEIVDGITPFMLRGNERIAIYDTKTGSIRQGKIDMISDALSVGRENASKVFIKSEKHNSSEIYIYE